MILRSYMVYNVFEIPEPNSKFMDDYRYIIFIKICLLICFTFEMC